MTGTGRKQPLYRVIARDIWRTIGERRLNPGEALPTEADLAQRYEVNRLTVRQAMDELRRAGAIDIVHGRGAFVAERPTLVEFATRVHPGDSGEYWSSPGDASSGSPGHAPSLRRVTEQLLAPAPGRPDRLVEGADHLGVGVDEVVALHTLMHDAGQPWITNTYVISTELAGVREAFVRHGLMRVALAGLSDGPLVHHWRAFSAAACSIDDADALGLEVGAPLLVREGVMGTTDRPLVYVVRRMPGESARFVLHYLDPASSENH
ncbi:GntR family transcriptional regulator [Propionibacteriaceae bacterium G1746]|uniref:GntR family transcriptional regulator n=1 Tax=Aestuariimicrobium sp. G57 TaxID=3418485 RepID=UPI003C25C3B6